MWRVEYNRPTLTTLIIAHNVTWCTGFREPYFICKLSGLAAHKSIHFHSVSSDCTFRSAPNCRQLEAPCAATAGSCGHCPAVRETLTDCQPLHPKGARAWHTLLRNLHRIPWKPESQFSPLVPGSQLRAMRKWLRDGEMGLVPSWGFCHLLNK